VAIQNITYGSKTAITLTLTSIATGTGGRASTVVSNTANKYDDAVIQIQTNGSAAGNTGTLDFYVYTALGDTTYTDGATGSDAAFTVANRLNAVWVGSVVLNGTTAVTCTLPRSIAACFGGIMPEKWGLIAVNNSGAALSATAGNHVISYQGITYTVA
jgi:hypothetical protein